MIGKIRISDLRAVADQRPAGYLNEILAAGQIENDILHIEHAVYFALRKKYTQKDQPLSLGQKAATATGAAFRAAKAAMKGEQVRASQSEIDRRLTICKTCEFFVDNPMKCRKCGCYLNLKTRLETEHCPIQKW